MFDRTSILVLIVLALGFISATDARADDVARPANTQIGTRCDGVFHWLYVPGTESLDGSETGFEYICQTGTPSGPLLIYLQGVGACWDGLGCDCEPNAFGVCNPNRFNSQGFFKQSASDDGLTWAETYWGGGHSGAAKNSALGYGAGTEAAAFAGPTSPFNQNWNIVFIPSSTGDAFMGDAVRQFTTNEGKIYFAHFRGYRDITLDLAQIKSLFPNPEKIVIWGASGGAAGTDCNLAQFRAAWPSTSMWKMSNAMPALGIANLMPLAAAVFQTWGVWKPGPVGTIVENTCPIMAPPGSADWNFGWVVQYNANKFESVRKALTADYADVVVSDLACLWGATPDSTGSCSGAVAATLTDEFNDVIGEAKNYKVFYHTGACHAEREVDGNSASDKSDPSCDFDTMVQNGVYLRDWVNAWINDSPAWVNVR